MILTPFNDLAHSRRFAFEDLAQKLPWGETSLFVCQIPVTPVVSGYVAALDFAALRQHRQIHRYSNDDERNFHFEWRHLASKPQKPVQDHARVYFADILPDTTGRDEFCADLTLRSELFCKATGKKEASCELRFAEFNKGELFHPDRGFDFTGGTAYLNLATAFVDAAYLPDPQTRQQGSVRDPQLAAHIRHPDLYDFYVFEAHRQHSVPAFKGRRLTLILN